MLGPMRYALVLLAVALSACAPSWDYVPVVERVGGGLAEAPGLATPAHIDRVEDVFAYYGTPTERTSPATLRVGGARPGREFVWNVATKAEDAAWLREHPAP